ncbi:hypothetical protein G4G28_12855 [Massilia sp. Dwa41.01b]|uniref:hypothetical protein n=1 Tax=Massilia sp. Dwa41.01b TaxID=2709302 RepID=UPI0016028838|nr:hypothetical protein [Massilia sp. Dwa41.01b]QNA89143.1 hypothetical protein G4G28_12855 [Massilia sp. Dwa41.01b]
MNPRAHCAVLGALLGAALALLPCGVALGQAGASVGAGMAAAERIGQEQSILKDKSAAGSLGRLGKLPELEQGSGLDTTDKWILEGSRGYPAWNGKIDPALLNGMKGKLPPGWRQGRAFPDKFDSSTEDPRVSAIIKAGKMQKYTFDDLVRDSKELDVPREWGLAPGTIKRPRGSCPQCQEVDPGPAGVVLTQVHKLPLPSSTAEIAALGLAKQDSAACSSAVKEMRLQDASGYSLVDDERFRVQCLAAGGDGRPGALGADRKPEVAACFALYAQFDETSAWRRRPASATRPCSSRPASWCGWCLACR